MTKYFKYQEMSSRNASVVGLKQASCLASSGWALAGRKEVQEECTLRTKKLGHKRISQALPSAEFGMIIFYSSKHHYRRNGKKNKIYILEGYELQFIYAFLDFVSVL